jgi:pyridoxine/pyridoxamine 5'-phosphate oxidase
MTREELRRFLESHRWAVQASNGEEGTPQAAVVGFAVTERMEIVFDTVGDSRKARNLRRDPRVALVVGWDEEQTVQIEGDADEPTGTERERIRNAYFAKFPDGRERLSWPGITHFRVRPRWIRYSDFRGPEPRIVEIPP